MNGEQAPVRPNWVALSIVLASGFALGLLPFWLFLQVPYVVAIACFIYTVIVVPWRGRGFVSCATEPPGPLEWLLAGWNAVAVGAAACIVGYVWYVASYAVVWSLVHAASALGWTIGMNPSSVATYVSTFFVALFAVAGPISLADEVPSKLYPLIAGTRSVFFPLAAQRWKLAALAFVGVAGAIAAVTLFGLDVHGPEFTVALSLFFALTGSPLLKLGQRKRPPSAVLEALRALSKLLAAAGYTLTERPRTGSPEVDPLISSVDLLALAGDRGYAIQVKVVGSGESDVQWQTASDVRRGAKALQEVLRDGDKRAIEVEPYLVVVGGRIGDELRVFASEEGVKLVHFADIEALRPGAEPDLRAMAVRRLQVPPGSSPSISPLGPSVGAAR